MRGNEPLNRPETAEKSSGGGGFRKRFFGLQEAPEKKFGDKAPDFRAWIASLGSQ